MIHVLVHGCFTECIFYPQIILAQEDIHLAFVVLICSRHSPVGIYIGSKFPTCFEITSLFHMSDQVDSFFTPGGRGRAWIVHPTSVN